MKLNSRKDKNQRRTFLKNMAGVAAVAATPGTLQAMVKKMSGNIPAKGFAAYKAGEPLSLWNFERRPVGDNDIQIAIKYCGICHSDIHTVRDEWGPQKYPLIPGHEIAGIVTAVGKNVKDFKVGDKAGVGCMVDSCGTCNSCNSGSEQHCDNRATVFTYGSPDPVMGGVTQGGYADTIVVQQHFVIKIPQDMDLQYAAPLLCAGVTTYSPIILNKVKKGMKVGIAGIGGLGHIAIQLASSLGAEVYAFTTSADKVTDIRKFGAKQVIVVDDTSKLRSWFGKMDYVICTIPAKFDLGAYTSLVKPYGHFTQLGLPAGELSFNNFSFITNRVNYSGSLIGGVSQTQEVIDYCAKNKILPQVQLIKMSEVNSAFTKVIEKRARYRFVLDTTTI